MDTDRPPEIIETDEVTLRRWREEDLDEVFRAVTESLDHLRPWMPWAADYGRETAAGFLTSSIQAWADGTAYNYAIVKDGVLAGSCGLMARIGAGGLEIGYWIRQGYTRRGLATAATAALVGEAFRLPGVERVEILTDELNEASAGVPRKLGFAQAGRRPLDPPPAAGSGIGVIWRLAR